MFECRSEKREEPSRLPTEVRVTCYSSVRAEDAKTKLFESLVEDFRRVTNLNDEQLAELVPG